ncbi:DUF1573 domain-containing protein [Gimesia fumaroli]|nr:DUF1573 domain-containing protein [Gimesia fumaroli]
MMGRFLVGFLSVTIGVLVIASLWRANRSSSAAVYVSPSVELLGSVNPEEKSEVSVTFRLHNATAKPLMITNTLTSCVCTKLDVSSFMVPAGEYSDITMLIETKKLRGHHKISAQVWTDNLEFPYFDLAATGDFAAGDSISPFYVTLPPVTPGEKVYSEFDIPGLQIESVSVDSIFDSLNVTFENTTNDENVATKLIFDGIAPKQIESHTAKFNVSFKGIDSSTGVNVFLTVLNRLKASPSGVNFGLVNRSSEVEQSVQIVDRLSSEFKSVKLESAPDFISLADVGLVDSVAKVKLKFKASSPDEFFKDQLQLSVTLDDGTVESIHLPVQARIISQ